MYVQLSPCSSTALSALLCTWQNHLPADLGADGRKTLLATLKITETVAPCPQALLDSTCWRKVRTLFHGEIPNPKNTRSQQTVTSSFLVAFFPASNAGHQCCLQLALKLQESGLPRPGPDWKCCECHLILAKQYPEQKRKSMVGKLGKVRRHRLGRIGMHKVSKRPTFTSLIRAPHLQLRPLRLKRTIWASMYHVYPCFIPSLQTTTRSYGNPMSH